MFVISYRYVVFKGRLFLEFHTHFQPSEILMMGNPVSNCAIVPYFPRLARLHRVYMGMRQPENVACCPSESADRMICAPKMSSPAISFSFFACDS